MKKIYFNKLMKTPKGELVNQLYNAMVSDMANYDESDEDKHGHRKRIPYIGWFYRYSDFVNKEISIGNSGSFIGVMENNKWDCPERYMTKEEVDIYMDFIERAIEERSKGGLVSELYANRDKVLDEMWDWFQTLKINTN